MDSFTEAQNDPFLQVPNEAELRNVFPVYFVLGV